MNKTKKITLTALLSAVALVLSFIEGSFVFVPHCPGVKVGLSNIVIMFALFCINKKTAISICILKALFALLTRGATAGLLSLSGGIVSITIIIVVSALFNNVSTAVLSVLAALSHNLAQFAVISLIYAPTSMLPYLPLLIVSGIVFGVANAIFLHAIKPSLIKLWSDK